ncbi:MAG: SRPBCC domain-containing protein [Comamonadaceae bacterium]|nr:MAG: SRPBCC domain-containing protein [Comamonadaceae bacterium]
MHGDKSAMSTSNLVRARRTYTFTANTVYEAWLNPALVRQFLFATPPEGKIIECTIDGKVGGGFRITARRPQEGGGTVDMLHVGRYLQLDPAQRIAFSFSVPQVSPQETTVAIELDPAGDSCTLTLRHDLGPAGDDAQAAQQTLQRTLDGWVAILRNLDEALQNQ